MLICRAYLLRQFQRFQLRRSRIKEDKKDHSCRFRVRGLSASPAETTRLKPYHPDREIAAFGHLVLQFLEGRTGVLDDGSASKTGEVTVIPIRFCLVVVLLALEVHEIEFID